MCAWKFLPALAAGNVIIHKPSEETPLSILKFCEIFDKAGFPKGIFNVVIGVGAIAGKALAMHNEVDCISFTGSVPVARDILKSCSESNLKKVNYLFFMKACFLDAFRTWRKSSSYNI